MVHKAHLKLAAFLAVLLTGIKGACLSSAVSCNYTVYPEPIVESYQIMLGRNPTPVEIYHFSSLIFDGSQVAYFEPYYGIPKNNRSVQKCGWIAYVDDPQKAGISHFNANEWVQRHALFGYYVTALYRTLTGQFPEWDLKHPDDQSTSKKLSFWTNKLAALGGVVTSQSLRKISTEMRRLLGRDIKISEDVVQIVFKRELGREASLKNCSINLDAPLQPGSDCYFLNGLASGQLSYSDVAHQVRSTAEYLKKNVNAACISGELGGNIWKVPDNSDLYDQHGIGEYISELYRLTQGQFPSQLEIDQYKQKYSGGDTQALLKDIAEDLQQRVHL